MDLNVLFSAGVFGSCDTGTFVPLPEVEAILGIVPSGEGVIDPMSTVVAWAFELAPSLLWGAVRFRGLEDRPQIKALLQSFVAWFLQHRGQ